MAIRKVGDCRILGPLGKGGMAQVYRGLHEALQRPVAIKELTPEGARDEATLARFQREALALSTFRHQHIVTLYDFIEKNGGWYMLMELVDGPTLAELIHEAPLPPPIVAVLGLQLSQALEHAHFRRVVHRDLKPTNVMLSRLGETKLMDFGIAQNEELERLTRAGLAVGTPAYMSPEQITGAAVDARSDIYSLGVVLYEALCGRKAFTGASAGEIFTKVIRGQCPALRKAAPDAPRALRNVIEQMMALEPAERFEHMTFVRRAFETLLSSEPHSASSMLVAFLRDRSRLSASEAASLQSDIALSGVALTSPSEPAKRRRRWPAALLLALAAGAASATAQHWTPALRALVCAPAP